MQRPLPGIYKNGMQNGLLSLDLLGLESLEDGQSSYQGVGSGKAIAHLLEFLLVLDSINKPGREGQVPGSQDLECILLGLGEGLLVEAKSKVMSRETCQGDAHANTPHCSKGAASVTLSGHSLMRDKRAPMETPSQVRYFSEKKTRNLKLAWPNVCRTR